MTPSIVLAALLAVAPPGTASAVCAVCGRSLCSACALDDVAGDRVLCSAAGRGGEGATRRLARRRYPNGDRPVGKASVPALRCALGSG